jgi:hypothetical protein
MTTIETSKRAFGGNTSDAAHRAWETKRRRAAERAAAAQAEVMVERIARHTAEALAEKALRYTDDALAYAGAVLKGEKPPDKGRLQAAGLILSQGHAAAVKRVAQATLSLQAVLERPDADLLAEAMRALPDGAIERLNVVRSTPALSKQGDDLFA